MEFMNNKIKILSLFLAMIFFFSGCKDSPSEVVSKMINSAKEGRKDDFLNGFAQKSRGIVSSMIDLANIYGLSRDDPLKMLTQSEVLDENIEGDRAYVTVKDERKSRKLLLIKEEGQWRIDIIELEKFWQSEK
jgi:hypothetical protein